MKKMSKFERSVDGAIWLPIVDIDFALHGFKRPHTAKSVIGARRQVVEKAVQMLEKAKRNQVDGQVRLDVKDIGLLLQATALTVEWMGDLIHFRLTDDDQD